MLSCSLVTIFLSSVAAGHRDKHYIIIRTFFVTEIRIDSVCRCVFTWKTILLNFMPIKIWWL